MRAKQLGVRVLGSRDSKAELVPEIRPFVLDAKLLGGVGKEGRREASGPSREVLIGDAVKSGAEAAKVWLFLLTRLSLSPNEICKRREVKQMRMVTPILP